MSDLTRDSVRDAASTLAHMWSAATSEKDRQGVDRIIQAFSAPTRCVVSALVLHFLEQRGFYTQAAALESLMFDHADIGC